MLAFDRHAIQFNKSQGPLPVWSWVLPCDWAQQSLCEPESTSGVITSSNAININWQRPGELVAPRSPSPALLAHSHPPGSVSVDPAPAKVTAMESQGEQFQKPLARRAEYGYRCVHKGTHRS